MTAEPMAEAYFDWLASTGRLEAENVTRLKRIHAGDKIAVADLLAELSPLNDIEIAQSFAAYLGIGFAPELGDLDLAHREQSISLEWQVAQKIFLSASPSGLKAYMSDPFSTYALDAIRFHLGQPFERTVTTRKALQAFFDRADRGPGDGAGIAEDGDILGDDESERLKEISSQAPNVKLVADILSDAVTAGASDIHLEPVQNAVHIRLRLGGELSLRRVLEKSRQQGLLTRLKVLANLNLAERRLPQDGRCRVTVGGDMVDFRVATMPSVFGETIVLRILSKKAQNLKLDDLGFEARAIGQIKAMVTAPNGLVLVTGPTGSGKTTTLYAVLAMLNASSRKIFTIEDPVEYRLEGVTQTQVEPNIGLSFATALRSVLRHDPDVILVGEIRDMETATIAFQAAMTGHLVLATVHTNSAIAAVARLRDMGIAPYLIAGSLRGVISQRLAKAGERSDRGALHRIAISEILPVSEALAELISRQASDHELAIAARREGFVPLAEQILSGVSAGLLDVSSLALVAGAG